MYICLCNGVTENHIRQAANSGVRSFDELKQCTGVSSQCGTCSSQAQAVLENCIDEIHCYDAMTSQLAC